MTIVSKKRNNNNRSKNRNKRLRSRRNKNKSKYLFSRQRGGAGPARNFKYSIKQINDSIKKQILSRASTPQAAHELITDTYAQNIMGLSPTSILSGKNPYEGYKILIVYLQNLSKTEPDVKKKKK